MKKLLSIYLLIMRRNSQRIKFVTKVLIQFLILVLPWTGMVTCGCNTFSVFTESQAACQSAVKYPGGPLLILKIL